MRCILTGIARDGNGNIVPSSTITPFLAGTSTATSIYTTLAGAVAVNSVTAGADGSFSFYVDRFDYDRDQCFDIQISKTGWTTWKWTNVDIRDVVLGTYAIAADKTVTTNLGYIPKGVIYAPATGKTLTISGKFDAGDYQIFSGTGTVTGLKYINAKWWGATGDGATDDTTELQAALTAMSTGSTLDIPYGVYKITSELTLSSVAYVTINFLDGAYITPDSCGGLLLTSVRRSRLNRVYITRASRDWTTDDTGLTLYECKSNHLDISYIGNFYKNLKLYSTSNGTYYNDIFLGTLAEGHYGIYWEQNTTGSVNDNTFYGGLITLSNAIKTATAAYSTTSYGLYQSIAGSHVSHALRMYGTTFEKLHNGLYMYSGQAVLDGLYIEQVDNYWIAGLLATSHIRFATWADGAQWGYAASKINLNHNSRNNIWLGLVYNNNNVTMFTESKYGGMGWINTYSRDLDFQLFANATNNFLTVLDPASVKQYFNKQYESATAPTSGTYYKGSVVWNSSPSAGDVLGWICTTTGTMGTLAGITASGTSGEASVTVNSTTGLYTSARITIAGVTGTKVITGISGTTVYLSGAIDATVSSAAVAYYNAVFAEINAQLSYRSGTASPSGVRTPFYVGENFLDSTAKVWYKATGTGNTDWVALNE